MNLMCALTGHDWGEFGMDARVLCKRCRRPKVEPVTGVAVIAAERERQLVEEGWTLYHDKLHAGSEIAFAAAAYAIPEECRDYDATHDVPFPWPWGGEWWKPSPSDRVRELAKAGALIAAEIDRLQAVSA